MASVASDLATARNPLGLYLQIYDAEFILGTYERLPIRECFATAYRCEAVTPSIVFGLGKSCNSGFVVS